LNPEDIIQGSVRLSSLPVVYFKINEVINNPDSSFEDVANVINHDSSLSARLLRIVNSSFYNFPSPIETISHALSIIGTQQLRDLALATTFISVFRGVPEQWISMNSFWRHSLACAIAARAVGMELRDGNTEKLFLGAMLHDIGKLILLENRPDSIWGILEQGRTENKILHLLEREHFGFNHGHVGAALLQAWNLPESLAAMVQFHHDPMAAGDRVQEAAAIHFADFFVKAMELGSSGDPLVPPLNPEAWEVLGLSTGFLERLWSRVDSQWREIVDIFLFG